MFDMTGAPLIGYLLRVARDIVARNPRFQRTLGDVSIISGNRISFGNVQVLVSDVNMDANRLSFDNFVCTTTGRAILAQVPNKDGQFIEYLVETDTSLKTPEAGVYYFNVDSVDEATREMILTMETFRWYEGKIRNARGTKISLASGINGIDITVTDPTQPGVAINTQPFQEYVYLLSNVGALTLTDASGAVLTPVTQYWIEGERTEVLTESTTFGTQILTIPDGFLSVSLVDQDGFVLREGKDYTLLSPTTVQLSPWTPSGQTISAVGAVALDPRIPSNLINPENILPFTLTSGETLADGQVFVYTQEGSISIAPNAEGQIILSPPLPPGGYCDYEARVLVGQTKVGAYKNAVNNQILPGLRIAIGDKVVVDDQVAILVSPTITETYRVYGGKPPISFTLECKANDPSTADELAKALFVELLYKRKDNLEADGLSLLEAGSSMTGGPRDDTGVSGTYSTRLSFTGLADWREFEPLVTRVKHFTVTADPQLGLTIAKRHSGLGVTGFLPDYR